MVMSLFNPRFLLVAFLLVALIAIAGPLAGTVTLINSRGVTVQFPETGAFQVVSQTGNLAIAWNSVSGKCNFEARNERGWLVSNPIQLPCTEDGLRAFGDFLARIRDFKAAEIRAAIEGWIERTLMAGGGTP